MIVRATFSGLFYIETDHLGTPRMATGPYGGIAWRWIFTDNAFGTQPAETIGDGDAPGLQLNLRFPGQYYDAETGLHYNYFRDYEPQTGRYVQSDPIGLHGGVNTYGYVGQNPLVYSDAFGLFFCRDFSDMEREYWFRRQGEYPEESCEPRPPPRSREEYCKSNDCSTCLERCLKAHSLISGRLVSGLAAGGLLAEDGASSASGALGGTLGFAAWSCAGATAALAGYDIGLYPGCDIACARDPFSY